MRTELVVTNRSCNQNCRFCAARRAKDEPGFVASEAVSSRIDAAIAQGAKVVVLSGGEPTMRRDLVQLVLQAKAGGAEQVVLETNGTLLDAVRISALGEAGLDRVRVHLPGWGEAADEATRDPGGFARTRECLLALASSTLELEVQTTLAASTAEAVAELPLRLRELLGPEAALKQLTVAVPTESPDPDELLAYPEAVEALKALDAAAKSVGFAIKLAPGGPPPCVFPARRRPTHLFSLAGGGSERPGFESIEACDGCEVAVNCPGFASNYLQRWGVPPVHPIREDRVRRRLSLISTIDEQIQREFVTVNRIENPAHGVVFEDIIRVNFHCNQSCRFCFVSTHLPAAGDEAVRKAIKHAGERGVKITLSGGEPLLNSNIFEYVRLAKSVSKLPVQLQTNAIRLDDPERAEGLAEAGLDEAFISLHGSKPEISDAVTSAPGTFVRSIVGIDNLSRTSVKIVLNFVICETNLHDLNDWVKLVGERWPNAYLNISFVAPSTDVVPRDRQFVPRYSDVLPRLGEAIAYAAQKGLDIGGFESMCGIPMCLVPSSLDHFCDLTALPEGFDGGEFRKTEACSRCDLAPKCYGLRRGYLDLHGADELRPVIRPI